MNSYPFEYLDVATEVADAIAAQRAVVALESTIIAHGMPYPRNIETAQRLEAEIRSAGAIPATIGVLDGKLRVGLTLSEMERFGKKGQEVAKASRRDLPYLIMQKAMGATTVAATLIGARLARIPVFATGGIGGVHRGATETFDVSADLPELARTNVAVVSAGAKSLLDLSLTLEYLETLGVPVVGYQTNELPAFYTRTSGLQVDYRLDQATAIAQLLWTKWSMGLEGGVLVANPIPLEYALEPSQVDGAIEQALTEAARAQVRGKALTPFLLGRVVDLTGGLSLEANIALVQNNARLAAEIAVALAATS